MNQENDTRQVTDIDPAVSDFMKALADETASEHLDRAVMREARRALRADNRSGSFGAWFRPLAFVVMVGLSLAIILDLSELSIFEPLQVPDFASPPAAATPDPLARDRDVAAEIDSQATANEPRRREKPAAAEPRAGDERQRNTGSDAAAPAMADANSANQAKRSKLRPQALPVEHAESSDISSAEHRQAGMRQQTKAAGSDTVSQPQPAASALLSASQAATEALSQAAAAACSEEQKSAPASWWQCIESLRQAGQAEAAEREQEELRNAFPEFVPAQ